MVDEALIYCSLSSQWQTKSLSSIVRFEWNNLKLDKSQLKWVKEQPMLNQDQGCKSAYMVGPQWIGAENVGMEWLLNAPGNQGEVLLLASLIPEFILASIIWLGF